MIETPTVLILGAGASKPYDYPLGIDLKDKIIRRLYALQKKIVGGIQKPKKLVRRT